MPDLIYIASPYSDPSPAVRARRFRAAVIAVGMAVRAGKLAISPIAHSHPVAVAARLAPDWESWRALDIELLQSCDVLAVLTLPGWELSRGVAAEIMEAKRIDLPVEFWDDDAAIAWRESERE